MLDTVSQTTAITDFSYQIGSGDFVIGPNLQHTFSECPLTFSLIPAGQYNQNVFAFN